MAKLSIILPTRNRAEILKVTLTEISKCKGFAECELIICNDGSTDNTKEIIQQFVTSNSYNNTRVFDDGNYGVAYQRNRAANVAKGLILLFAADDIRPTSSSWLESHILLHSHQTSDNFAVLGKIVWPSNNDIEINEVMRVVQGVGGEQFGFADLDSNTYLDWRFFYTSNLSVKKSITSDWLQNGFSTNFKDYGYEDIEFAYRLSIKTGLNLFYSSSVTAKHFQNFTVADFCNRQIAAGKMASTFAGMHPEIRSVLIPETNFDASNISNVPHILNIVEGIKSYCLMLEKRGELGCEAWHSSLLHLLFKAEYLLGISSNYDFENQGHLSFFLNRMIEELFENFSRDVSMKILGINLTKKTKSKPGFNLHIFGRTIFIPYTLYKFFMKNVYLRKLGLFIKNNLGGRLS